MISVIITTHEPLLKHLARCLASVVWQLGSGDEVIIVFDRCPQAGREKFHLEKDFNSSSMRVLFQDRDVLSGECATRNLGLAHAQGDWIKFLDGDDLLAPFALNAFRKAVEQLPPDVAVLAGSQVKVHNGVVKGIVDPPDIEALITRVNPIVPSMVFVRRAAAEAVGGFDERIDFEGDWDFWLRLRRAGHRCARLRVPFCYYWIDDTERAEKETQRTHQVEGMDVREYFAKTHGITPER